MIRKIIKIDESRCNGCALCAAACHEGAIGMVNGKAKLLREDYCDGLGDCLPACPMNAISFEMREAPAYDEMAVLAAKVKRIPNAEPAMCSAETAETMEGRQITGWITFAALREDISAMQMAINTAMIRSITIHTRL